jgi:hypothetical protein
MKVAKLVNLPVLFIGDGGDKEKLIKIAGTNKV